MKKIFLIAVVTIGVSSTSIAQIKKAATTPTTVASKTEVMTSKILAQKNVDDLTAFTKFSPEMTQALFGLFSTKQDMLRTAGNNEEERKQVARIISKKLELSMDNTVFEKLKANTTLYQSLIN